LSKVYSAKDLRDRLKISPKMFKQRADKLKILYKIDLSKYRDLKSGNSSNYKFNLYELELLIILFKAVNTFPIKITDQNFSDGYTLQKAKTETPESFLKFMISITESIDAIEDHHLKTYIFASDSYDQTCEYISSQNKLHQSLSSFFQYTGTLDFKESSKRQRELAYRIDEMLYELMGEEKGVTDIKKKDDQHILKSPTTNLSSFHREYENSKLNNYIYNNRNDTNEEIKDLMLDKFLIETLKKLEESREYLQENIKERYERKKYNNDTQLKMMYEELTVWEVMDPYSIQIQNSSYENIEKIRDKVDYYKKSNYRKMDYLSKLKIIQSNYENLESHQHFSYHLQNFYKELQKITILTDINRNYFIEDGVAEETIDHFIYDTKRIYKLIENYDVSGKIRGETKVSVDRFFSLVNEFEKIKTTSIGDEDINNNTEKLTTWNFAEKMNDVINRK